MRPNERKLAELKGDRTEKSERLKELGRRPADRDCEPVSVVIVTHNSHDFVDCCLESIRRNTVYHRYEVWVVDNDSRDDTKELVWKYAEVDQRVHLVALAGNMGFAAATNLGARRSHGGYLIVLNIDTVVTFGWMQRLVRQARQDPAIGAVTAVTNSAGNEVRIDIPYRTPGEMERFAAALARDKLGQSLEIAVAPLFCVLIPRSVWDDVEGLDERFKIGMFEDDDFALKLRERGLRIVCAEDCFVHHFGRGAFGRLSSARYQAIFEQNRRRFEQKWGTAWQPHSYRRGVYGEDYRFSPAEFLAYAPAHIRERLAKTRLELETTRNRLAQKDAALSQRDTTLAERDKQLAAQISEAEQEKRELTEKDQELRQLRLERDQSRQQSEELEKRLASERAAVQERLRQAETLREQTVMGLGTFQDELLRNLEVYRSQRAWKVMLFLRKAYRLVVREGVKGSFSLLRWSLGLVLGKTAGLEQEELRFPDVRHYIPDELQAPFLPQPKDPAPAKAPQKKTYDLIFLPVFDFDFRFQRPQQLAAEFGRRGHRVFWVSPFKRLSPSADKPFRAVPLCDNVWEVRLRVQCPDIFGGELQEDDVNTIISCLQELFADFEIAESVAFLELPFWRRIGLALRQRFGSGILYDCIDDWASMPGLGAFNVSEEAKLTEECDLLVVTGQGLAEKHARAERSLLLVRNAADFEQFSAAEPNDELTGVPKPIVGYFGAIADWFDFDLVYGVARSRPDYSFVLIGAYGLEKELELEQASNLRRLPNVFLCGHKEYDSLPAYLAHFDVAIIPFAVNALTKATDPVKLYEYFSQGKPVVATRMPELSRCSELVYLADGVEDFAQKLDRALSEQDENLKRRRVSFAARNSWSQRYETLDKAIGVSFPLVSILIVTHNNSAFVDLCLHSIRTHTRYPSYDVVVVDNASGDDTYERVERYAKADPRIRPIRLAENTGFPEGMNIAAGKAAGEFLVFLNVDTMVTSGWLHRLLRHYRGNERVGAVVAVTNWAGNEARINIPYRNRGEMEKFAASLAEQNLGESREIGTAPLFCTLVSRGAWNRVGELDTGFGAGMFEDDDYSTRMRKEGFRILSAEDCFVHHFGMSSFGELSRRRYQALFDQNRSLYEQKWGVRWTPHRPRPGVRDEPVSFDVNEFVADQDVEEAASSGAAS